jgi:hypothetical protein
VLSLGGLSLGNNILLLFQKNMCIYIFYPKFLTKRKVMRAGGTHAVPG